MAFKKFYPTDMDHKLPKFFTIRWDGKLREDFKKKISKKNDIVQKAGGGVSEKNQILNVWIKMTF